MLFKDLLSRTHSKKTQSSKNELYEIHNSYLSFIKDILSYSYPTNAQNPNMLRLNAINKILRILALDEQHYILQYPIKGNSSYSYFPILLNNRIKCPKCGILSTCNLIISKTNNSIAFDIAHHPTISRPWERERLIRSLSNIGYSVNNPFISDERNHWGGFLYPQFNLLFIKNGYHSSTSGILDTTAIFYPEYLYDCSSFYKEIYFDGISFRHIKCGHIIETPGNKSIGTIYEIGRLVFESKLSFLDLLQNEKASSPALIRDK